MADLVAEAFANVLAAIQSGNGPTVFFRAYLLTTLRRLASAKRAADGKQVAVDDLETVIVVEVGSDPVVAAFEKDVVSRSFKDLPERWQAVLWYTEVDGMAPADISPMLGITPNAVAALAVRAREGLKQAYLQNHISAAASCCDEYAKNLGAYARGGLTRRRKEKVEAHLQGCLTCSEMLLHIEDVGVGMRTIIFPAVAGLAFVGEEIARGAAYAAAPLLANGVPAVGAGGAGVGGAGAGSVGLGSVGLASAGLGSAGVGAFVTASAVGVVLLGAVVASAVGLSHVDKHGKDAGPLPTDITASAPATETQHPSAGTASRGEALSSATAASAVPDVPAQVHISTVPPDPDHPLAMPEGSQLVPLLPAAPAPTPAPARGQAPSKPAQPAVEPSELVGPPTSAPAPTPAPTSTPAPTQAPDPEATFSVTGSLLSQTALETVFQLEISRTGSDLDSPKVSFNVPRLWMGLPVVVTPPAGWSCVDSATILTAGSTCTATRWSGAVGTFMLRVPTPSILQGYPVEISVSAGGAAAFNGWLWFN